MPGSALTVLDHIAGRTNAYHNAQHLLVEMRSPKPFSQAGLKPGSSQSLHPGQLELGPWGTAFPSILYEFIWTSPFLWIGCEIPIKEMPPFVILPSSSNFSYSYFHLDSNNIVHYFTPNFPIRLGNYWGQGVLFLLSCLFLNETLQRLFLFQYFMKG
jgi:hypothetical protein